MLRRGWLVDAGGLMEPIVIQAGLEIGVIGAKIFTILTAMAFITILVMTTLLNAFTPGTRPQVDIAQDARHITET